MIDIASARAVASDGVGTDAVSVSRRWIEQVVAEIEAGRAALAALAGAPAPSSLAMEPFSA